MSMNASQMLSAVRLPTVIEPDLRQALENQGKTVTVPQGTFVFQPEQQIETFLIVGAGSLRVFKSSDDGREITLYNVGGGECCTLNVLCLLTGRLSPATALIDEEVTALAYSRAQFLDWFSRYRTMRELVLGQMADRVHCMMALVEEVAFQKLDRRLATYLTCAADESGSPELALTHEAVARDLGSVREVVSRILKNFEGAGLVSLGRGKITLRDRSGLDQILL